MKKFFTLVVLSAVMLLTGTLSVGAQQRRPIDSQHPLWMIHCDVWFKADPQKIIDLIPEDIRPYVCLNLSLSCQFDKDLNRYKMPHYAFQTYKSWGSVCQKNGIWFTCQPASGGHTHIQDDDMATFEFFFKQFPNFLGWNYAEQFWGFDEGGDKSSSTQTNRWALFARLVEMSHKYGGFLTVSFCGNIWSHPLNPIGELKRTKALLDACKKYPDAMLFLYKYTTSSCFYNNESVSFGPFISGLTCAYGVRYDNCGWNGAMDALLGEGHGKKYPGAAGIGTVMEQTCVNGGAVWDGPELTWREECMHEISQTTVDGYTRRNWARFDNMNGVWIDMFRKIIDGTMYIPTREEVVGKTKIVIINNVTSGSDEDKYATWGDLYDGLYKQTDPFNKGDGRWMNNFCYFKKTGRYGAIPMVTDLYDDVAKSIPVQVKKTARTSRWSTQAKKVNEFNTQYPQVSTGDLYVNRYRNQLVTYTPYTYLNSKKRARADIPLLYNTCSRMVLSYDKLSGGVVREYPDHIDFYLNNYRADTIDVRTDSIYVYGVGAQPTYTMTKHPNIKNSSNTKCTEIYDPEGNVYILVVKHCGGVDVTINCAGSEDTTDATDAIPAATPLPLPQQPEQAARCEVLIEGEDMDFKNIKSCVTSAFDWYKSVVGHSGNGFADMGANTSGALRHQLQLKDGQEGSYIISIRYTCATKAGNIRLNVNGASQTLRCEKTATNEWRYVRAEATMKVGKNNLVITNTGGLPMYIDQISYRPTDVAPMKYAVEVRQAKTGTVTPVQTEAAEGDTVAVNVNAPAGYRLSQLRLVNSVFFTLGRSFSISDGTLMVADGSDVASGVYQAQFVMPNDNVTLVPVFVDASAVYKLDFGTVDNGSMPPGWRCVQENGDVHEYPSSFSQGARTMAGFGGHQGKALYWRKDVAEYGRQSAFRLTLQSGSYKLTYAMAAWKGSPKYKVEIKKLTGGDVVASSATYTASPNVNGNTAASVSSATNRTLEFDIEQEGNYVVSFSNQTGGSDLDEFLLLECSVNLVSLASGMKPVVAGETPARQDRVIYDAAGHMRHELGSGLNIIRYANGQLRKVFRK
jgi:hypothetical protein